MKKCKKFLPVILSMALILSFCVLGAGAVSGTTIYVNAGASASDIDGTAEHPYLSVSAAAAVAESGDTIKLLGNAPTDGFIDVGKTCKSGVTFDLNGFTMSVAPAGGSANTETNGFRVLKGNTATIKNGTVTAAYSSENKIKVLFANYGTLNLDALTVLHSGEYTGVTYTLNNAGTLNVSGSTITNALTGGTPYVLTTGDYYFSGSSTLNNFTNTTTIDAASVLNGNVYVEATTSGSTTKTILNGTLNGCARLEPTGGTYNTTVDGSATTFSFTRLGALSNAKAITYGIANMADLQAALSSAQNGDTIKLLGDIAMTSTITIESGKALSLDLNGKQLTASLSTAFKITNGTLTMIDSASTKGSFTASGEAFRVAGEKLTAPATSDKHPQVVVGSGVQVISSTDCCIFIYGANAAADVYGSLESRGSYATIQGNGNATSTGTAINIFPGASVKATAASGFAMYIPQAGVLNINGGTIEGASAIEVKAGTVNISGGTITATAASTTHESNSNGTSSSGYAFSLVNNPAYVPGVAVTISGGTFTGPVAALDDDSDSSNNTSSLSITGGTFSADPSAVAVDENPAVSYVASGYSVIENGNGTYTVYLPYTPASAPSPVTIPAFSGSANVEVTAQVSGTTATVDVSSDQLTEVLTSTDSENVTLDVSSLSGVESAVIPAQVITTVSDSDSGAGLTVVLPQGSVTLDDTALSAISEAAGGKDISVSMAAVTVEELSANQKSALGDKAADAIIIDVSVTAGNEQLSTFNGGSLTISVPYTPKDGEDTSNLVVYYLADDGSISPMTGKYNPDTGCYDFITPHLSQYVLMSFPFKDVSSNYWAYPQIVWAYNNGLTKGTSADTFGSEESVTRQQLWMLLARMAGADPADMTGAQQWAVANGISDGTNPTGEISREQTVTILYRYAMEFSDLVEEDSGAMGLAGFDDAGSISDFAYDAMHWAVRVGLINGIGSKLDPLGSASRAQFMVILNRFDGIAAK